MGLMGLMDLMDGMGLMGLTGLMGLMDGMGLMGLMGLMDGDGMDMGFWRRECVGIPTGASRTCLLGEAILGFPSLRRRYAGGLPVARGKIRRNVSVGTRVPCRSVGLVRGMT